MKICIPTTSDVGALGEVSSHLGRAPFLTVLDSESGNVTVKKNTQEGHGHGVCRLGPLMARWGVDAVVAPRVGRGALQKLAESGIDVLASRGRTVAEVAEEARRGALRRAAEDEVVCGGGGHSHGSCHS